MALRLKARPYPNLPKVLLSLLTKTWALSDKLVVCTLRLTLWNNPIFPKALEWLTLQVALGIGNESLVVHTNDIQLPVGYIIDIPYRGMVWN